MLYDFAQCKNAIVFAIISLSIKIIKVRNSFVIVLFVFGFWFLVCSYLFFVWVCVGVCVRVCVLFCFCFVLKFDCLFVYFVYICLSICLSICLFVFCFCLFALGIILRHIGGASTILNLLYLITSGEQVP